MSLLNRALAVATAAHKGQTDKAGLPYLLHPLAVAASLPLADLDGRTVALLHDTVEDTSVTLVDLAAWLPPHLVEAVDALTKRKGETLAAYWARCKANPVAARVKVADMLHNSSPGRLRNLHPKDAARLAAKYKKGLDFFAL